MAISEAVASTASHDAAGVPPVAAGPALQTHATALLAHPTIAVATTERGCVRACNAAWQTLFALPADVVVESHAATLFANPGAADRFERMLQATVQTRAATPSSGHCATVEHALVRRDGGTFAAEITVWLPDVSHADHALSADAIWQVRDLSAEHAVKRELRELETYHRELARHQWGMTFVIDRKGRIAYASPSVEEILGFRGAALLGESFTTLLDPAHAADAGHWLRGIRRRHRDDQTPEAHPMHVLDEAGRGRLIVCRARNCFDVAQIGGMVVHAYESSGHAGDGEEPSALRAALCEVATTRPGADPAPHARIAGLLDALRAALGATVVSFRGAGNGVPTLSSPAGRVDKRGRAPDDARPRVVNDLAADPATPRDAVASLAAAGVAALVELPVWTAAADVPSWLAVGTPEARDWSDGEIGLIVASSQAIASALSVAPDADAASPPTSGDDVANADAAGVDALTGLPDRAAAGAWLEREVARHAQDGTLTLLAINLDRFRHVNDRYGHATGDQVLVRSAKAIIEVVADGGYVARVGGDEFLVVLTNPTARVVDETIAMLLKRIAATDAALPRVEASIGTARLPSDAQDAATLWLYADLATREAKRRGRGQAFFFDARLASAVRVRKALDVEIAEALERNEFALFYQPQLALASGTVVGLEALLRWQHPTRGLLLPDVFIDAAVESGLIEAITKSVVGKVCEQIATWRRAGAFPEVPIGVNVAGTQFHDRRLPALVASALLRSGLPARLLVLELSEQTLVGDAAETERVVKELSRLGVRTAVGGFALGHGALKQLRQLRVAQIKVDRGFVDALPDDEASSVVVRTMIDIAKRLHCEVIAEGVETRGQYEFLRSLGCEAAQGFFFSPPLSADETRLFVENNRAHPVR